MAEPNWYVHTRDAPGRRWVWVDGASSKTAACFAAERLRQRAGWAEREFLVTNTRFPGADEPGNA